MNKESIGSIEYWDEYRPNAINIIFDRFYEDFDLLNDKTFNLKNLSIVSEHELLTDDIKYIFHRSKYKFDVSHHIYYIKYNDLNIGLIDGRIPVAFTGDYTTSNNASKSLLKSIAIRDNLTHKYKMMYEVAKDFYGEENVHIHLNSYEYEFKCLWSSSRSGLIIKHEPFWVEDTYGIKTRIQGGFTFISFNTYNPWFTNIYPDPLQKYVGYCHSHISGFDSIKFKDICTGSGSPINVSKSLLVDDFTEDNIYNYFINYQNMISKESEVGVPYMRMRNCFLESKNESDTRSLSVKQIINAIKEDKIKFHVSISDDVDVSLDMSSLDEYIASISTNSEPIYKDIKKSWYFINKLRSGREPADSSFVHEFYWKGESIKSEVVPFHEDNYQIDLDSSNFWIKMDYGRPSQVTVSNVIFQLEKTLKNIILEHNELHRIQSNIRFPKELFGVKKIGRGTNIDNIKQFTTTSQLSS